MGILKCTILAAFAVLLQTTDAVKGPWNTASNWPSGSPWWDSIGVDIYSTFVLPYPWSDSGYAAPDCFNADIDPITNMGSQLTSTFDAQRDCPMCHGYTHSTPGFAADPINCAMYYICDKVGTIWHAYHMPCPACTFWSQIDLTCILVDSVSCPIPTFQDGPTMFTPAPPTKLITCLTFDDGIGGSKGIWVLNDGVAIVPALPADNCVLGKCAYFDGSARLEVPRFSNSWSGFSQFAISVFINKQAAQNLQGIISNDCFGIVPMEPSNSVYVSAVPGQVNGGMKSPGAAVDHSIGAPDDVWVHLVLTWDGSDLAIYKDGGLINDQNFDGPIRRSPEHCPMVIGSFIWNQTISYFTGYLDEVCFFRTGLSGAEVSQINLDPAYAYGL